MINLKLVIKTQVTFKRHWKTLKLRKSFLDTSKFRCLYLFEITSRQTLFTLIHLTLFSLNIHWTLASHKNVLDKETLGDKWKFRHFTLSLLIIIHLDIIYTLVIIFDFTKSVSVIGSFSWCHWVMKYFKFILFFL